MEDAATAEISRAQLWQWVHSGARADDGEVVTADSTAQLRDEELAALGGSQPGPRADAARLLDQLVLGDGFPDFLTLPALELLP